jgi:hypothetical protein
MRYASYGILGDIGRQSYFAQPLVLDGDVSNKLISARLFSYEQS